MRVVAVQAAQEQTEREGVGVSKEAQQLFDCFCKTLPCKWQGKTIVVLQEVCTASIVSMATFETHPMHVIVSLFSGTLPTDNMA